MTPLLCRIESLHALAAVLSVENTRGEEAGRVARDAFTAAVRRVVVDVAARRGITACFVAHDGLVADKEGGGADFDALAAVAQKCAEAARDGAASASLGGARQLVVVGDEQKLAMVIVGPLVVGILAPVETSLGEALA